MTEDGSSFISQQWKTELEGLLNPGKVAVVGATEKVGPGRNSIFNLLNIAYEGDIYPVNPKHDTVFGLKCYPSLRELPGRPDAVGLAVPARFVVEAVKECIELGIKACTIFSSGFGELGEDGRKLQNEISSLAMAGQLRICGPNCLGHLNLHGKTGLYSASVPPGTKAGGIAVVSQSGSMAIAMFQAFKDLGVSHIISVGNQAVLDLADYLYYLSKDPHTKVITAFIEGIAQGKKFIDAVIECRKRGKAVVALKIGKSEVGRKVALAHTASMVGSYALYETAFEKCGVLAVNDIDEMVQTVTALIQTPPPTGKGIMLLAISGGQCGLIGDISTELGLEFAELGEETKQVLARQLPSYVNVNNPLDIAGVGSDNPDDYANVLVACAQDPAVGLILISQDAPNGIGPSTTQHYTRIVSGITGIYHKLNKPLIVFSNHSTPYDGRVVQPLLDAGIPYLQGTREALAAVKHLLSYHGSPHRDVTEGAWGEKVVLSASKRASGQVVTPKWEVIEEKVNKLAVGRKFLGEKEGKVILELLNVPVTREKACKDAEEAVLAAEKMGYPVALKIDSPDIAHKTDGGGVVLGLKSCDEVREAYQAMINTVKRRQPQAVINGVLVQEMVPDGVDVIIGIHEDRQFGKVMVYGLGGIYVEVFKDVSLGLLPVDEAMARKMIERSRSRELLKKCRGREALDKELLVDIMVKLSAFAERFDHLIQEIDLNPVRIGTFGVKTLDALMVLKK